MDKILRGVSEFIRRRRPRLRATFKRLAHGQNPVALLLTCSDSRVVSSLLLGTDPGDLFEVRTVGNLIAPASEQGTTSVGDESEAAAIEYALLALDVKHLVVMGHSGCGAMKAVLKGSVPAGALEPRALARPRQGVAGEAGPGSRHRWAARPRGPSLPGQCPPAARAHRELRAGGRAGRAGRSRASRRVVRRGERGPPRVERGRSALRAHGRRGDRAGAHPACRRDLPDPRSS